MLHVQGRGGSSIARRKEEQNRTLNNACVFVYKTCMCRIFFQNEINYLQKIFNIHIIIKSEDKIQYYLVHAFVL